MNQSSHLKRESLPKHLTLKGKTLPQILPFIPIFQNSLIGQADVVQATISAIIDTNKGEQELALTVYTKEPLTEEGLKTLISSIPKDIPADIPIKFEVLGTTSSILYRKESN